MCICDLRQSSSIQKNAVRFQQKDDSVKRHFFTDIISSITRGKFAPTSDNYIFSRDYLSVQIWDVRNSKGAVQTFNVTDYLDANLCELYESERIFDKFDL